MEEEEQAAKLDRELNAAYRSLRTKLSTEGRAALLTEEQAWLATRNAEPDNEKRAKLVQARVKELNARAAGRWVARHARGAELREALQKPV
jgi:uncharacterized protein YecT (DUF1311 family)